MFSGSKPDLNQVYQQGFQCLDLDQGLSRLLINAAKRLEFNSYSMDMIDHGPSKCHEFNPGDVPMPFNIFLDSLMESVDHVITLFAEEDHLDIQIGVARMSKGYEVRWHQDNFNQPALSFICILPGDELDPNLDGGTLEFRRVWYDQQFEIASSETVLSVSPHSKLARLVLFNPSSLIFQHRVTRMKTEKERHIIYGSFGEL